jgi:hypothetical protein
MSATALRRAFPCSPLFGTTDRMPGRPISQDCREGAGLRLGYAASGASGALVPNRRTVVALAAASLAITAAGADGLIRAREQVTLGATVDNPTSLPILAVRVVLADVAGSNLNACEGAGFPPVLADGPRKAT